MTKFGTCVFRQRPEDCKNTLPGDGCSANDWEFLQCYLDHYGNTLAKDAGLRLIDSMTHLIIDNENIE